MSISAMFYVSRIILTFVATIFIFNAAQRIDVSKIFKPDSTGEIKLIIIVLSFIIGYLFSNAIVSLFQELYLYI